MDIVRIDSTSPPGARMSKVVVYGDLVFVAGLTALDTSGDIQDQARDILAQIDGYLAKAGTSKSRLLQAQLWITDMANFSRMNEVWNGWVDHDNLPVRACVRADLARPEILLEIMVTAAK